MIALEARALSMPAGGIVRYVVGLLRGLAACAPSLSLTVLSETDKGCGAIQDFPCRVIPGGGRLNRLRWDRVLLPRAVRGLRPRLLHLTKPNGLLPREALPPVVMTIYDVIPLTDPDTQTLAQRTYWRFHLPRAARRADHILTISEASKNALVERFRLAPERITVTYPGLEPQFRPPSAAELFNLRQRYGLEAPYLLTVGTIEPRKNVHVLLRAFARIAATIPHTLVIGGRFGWKTGMVRRAAADPRLRGRVRFLNTLPDADLPILYGGADLFVFLSRAEGFGFPPVEALACGAPVAVSNRGSLSEVVGATAVTVDPDDFHAVVETIQVLLADDEGRERMRLAGPRWAARYRWETLAQQTLDVYRQLVGTL